MHEYAKLLAERCQKYLDSQPESLLETFESSNRVDGDIYIARLYGYDDQIDAELCLREDLDTLVLPIERPVTLYPAIDEPPIRALYTKSNLYTTCKVHGLYLRGIGIWDWPCRDDDMCRVIYRRYKRYG